MLNADQEGSKELMEKSVNHWLSLPGNILGFSCTGASSLHAAFGNGDKALEYLHKLFAQTLRPNTMYMESGPVIETPLSGAQCVHDMLLQSWGGKIRIFLAVPSIWEEATFQNLRTEGAFLVSAVRKGGKTINVHIKSLAGSPCILHTDMENPTLKASNASMRKLSDNEYELMLKKGETAIITPKGLNIAEISETSGKGEHFFGLKD